jgi:hypothetical protein
VNFLQDRRPVGEVSVAERGKRVYHRVDSRVTGGDESKQRSF